MSCDACTNEVPHEHGSHPGIHTFGIIYKRADHEELEEIDIVGTHVSRELAIKVADAGYAKGYSEVVRMTPGGSAGLVTLRGSW